MEDTITYYTPIQQQKIKIRIKNSHLAGSNIYDLVTSANNLFIPIFKKELTSKDLLLGPDHSLCIKVPELNVDFTFNTHWPYGKDLQLVVDTIDDWTPCHFTSWHMEHLIKKWFVSVSYCDGELFFEKELEVQTYGILCSQIWFLEHESPGAELIKYHVNTATNADKSFCRDRGLLIQMFNDYGRSFVRRVVRVSRMLKEPIDPENVSCHFKMSKLVEDDQVKAEIADYTYDTKIVDCQQNPLYEDVLNNDLHDFPDIGSYYEADLISRGYNPEVDSEDLSPKSSCSDSSEYEETVRKKQKLDSTQAPPAESSHVQGSSLGITVTTTHVSESQIEPPSLVINVPETASSTNLTPFEQELTRLGAYKEHPILPNIDENFDSEEENEWTIQRLYLKLNKFFFQNTQIYDKLSKEKRQEYIEIIEQINDLSHCIRDKEMSYGGHVFMDEFVEYPVERSPSDMRYIINSITQAKFTHKFPISVMASEFESYIKYAAYNDFNAQKYFHCMSDKQSGLKHFGSILSRGIDKFTMESNVGQKRSSTFYFVDKNIANMLKEFVLYCAKKPVDGTSVFLFLLNYFKPDSDGDAFIVDLSMESEKVYLVFDPKCTKMIIVAKWGSIGEYVRNKVHKFIEIMTLNLTNAAQLEITMIDYFTIVNILNAIVILQKFNVAKIPFSMLTNAINDKKMSSVQNQLINITKKKNSHIVYHKEKIHQLYAFKFFK